MTPPPSRRRGCGEPPQMGESGSCRCRLGFPAVLRTRDDITWLPVSSRAALKGVKTLQVRQTRPFAVRTQRSGGLEEPISWGSVSVKLSFTQPSLTRASLDENLIPTFESESKVDGRSIAIDPLRFEVEIKDVTPSPTWIFYAQPGACKQRAPFLPSLGKSSGNPPGLPPPKRSTPPEC